MGNFQIQHDRPNCIACGVCESIAPEFWEMDKNDGKSNLKACKKVGHEEHRDIDEHTFEENREAADRCPVNIIHIVNKETGERLI
ncbi:ferredoxin [Candidatus Woesearchaeota archaeon]|nr:ferredoxin [Candidatus Woesearchaeota archaeon]